jgi:predicted DNA repair protein MutK
MGVVSLATTALVYVPILGIMRSDNLAGWLESRDDQNGLAARAGASLRHAIPKIMKTLSVVGTVAMLEVGGGILAHKVPSAIAAVAGEGAGHVAHAAVAAVEHAFAFVPAVGGILGGLAVGGVFGAAMIGAAYAAHKLKAAMNKPASPAQKETSCGCNCACGQAASPEIGRASCRERVS